MKKLTRKQIVAAMYAIMFTLKADRGTMNDNMIQDLEEAYDKLQFQIENE